MQTEIAVTKRPGMMELAMSGGKRTKLMRIRASGDYEGEDDAWDSALFDVSWQAGCLYIVVLMSRHSID